MITFEKLQACDINYSNSKAIQTILKIRTTRVVSKRSDLMLDLFLMNHSIVVKNINNFWYLMRIYPNHRQTFDYCDLISEAYIVLHKCVDNFQRKNKLMTGRDGEYDVTKKEYAYDLKVSFYMYFNKSLTRSFYRLTEKYFKKHKNLRYSEDVFLDYSPNQVKVHPKIDLAKFDLKNMGLTPDEIELVVSRLEQVSAKNFVKGKKGFNTNKYYEQLSIIKYKINDGKE